VIACAVYPLALSVHRVSGEVLADSLEAIGLDPGVDCAKLWQAADVIDEHIGDEPVQPVAPRIAVRAAQHDLPAGLVAALDESLRAAGAADRLDETLEELERVRGEAGWPPLAPPIGNVLGSQAILNVLAASRYLAVVDELRALFEGHFGTPPGEIDEAARRAVALTADPETSENVLAPTLGEVRAHAAGLASSEEELLLLGLFGDEAEPLLRAVRGRASGDERQLAGVGEDRAERIRELVRIVQETGIGEVTIEEGDMRVSVRRTLEAQPAESAAAPLAAEGPPLAATAATPPVNGLVRIESPMVGTFYRAPQPGAPPFVEEGDAVAAGETLCILEAMKLMNEVKADVDAIVRRIHVANAEPVEFGQLLFELEPVGGRPLDAV
jgi:oxaloacetate decarboxylase (Na+ extruding) subunit alpha